MIRDVRVAPLSSQVDLNRPYGDTSDVETAMGIFILKLIKQYG
jgi:hypothetical protein